MDIHSAHHAENSVAFMAEQHRPTGLDQWCYHQQHTWQVDQTKGEIVALSTHEKNSTFMAKAIAECNMTTATMRSRSILLSAYRCKQALGQSSTFEHQNSLMRAQGMCFERYGH